MYNHGLICFLNAKSVSTKKAVTAFLESEGITSFTYKNHNRVNDYINNNWVKFSSFVDKSIKSGLLTGQAIKLNTYYDERRERHQEIKAEFERENLTQDEQFILNIESYDWGKVQSFIAKKGHSSVAKDYGYTSKKLQYMPTIRQLRELGLIEELVAKLKEQLEVKP